MNNLDWGLSTGSWTSGIWFGTHGDSVGFNVRPLAKPEDGEAKELGGAGSNCHYAEVMSEDGTFKGNGTLTGEVSRSPAHLDLDPHQTSSSSIPWYISEDPAIGPKELTARIQISVITDTKLSLPV